MFNSAMTFLKNRIHAILLIFCVYICSVNVASMTFGVTQQLNTSHTTDSNDVMLATTMEKSPNYATPTFRTSTSFTTTTSASTTRSSNGKSPLN